MVPIVTGTVGVLVAGIIILLMRKDRLHVNHGMGWIVVALGFSLLGFAPQIFDNLAQRIGIAYPPVLALTIGLSVLVLKILLMDVERSRIEIRNQRLIQRMAILEAEINALKSRVDETEGPGPTWSGDPD
ncbi:MAG: hypothetical protein ACJAYC_000198 [Halieaceae bacterium]|jgi:hypothetical protein